MIRTHINRAAADLSNALDAMEADNIQHAAVSIGAAWVSWHNARKAIDAVSNLSTITAEVMDLHSLWSRIFSTETELLKIQYGVN